MRPFYLLLFLFSAFSATAQLSLDLGYSLGVPQGAMAGNIKPSHSLSTGVMGRLPGALNRIQAGIEVAWGSYASTRKEQTFNFGGGVSTKTWVNYSSNVTQANLTARFMILKDKIVTPFLSGKAGYTVFYSNLYIEDPHDADGCKPLEEHTLIRDGTISAAYGGGVRLDWSLISKRKERGRQYLDFSVHHTSGSNIDYINTKELIDPSNPPVSSPGKPVNVRFINASTQQIHEHQVAEVYNTPLRMLEFRISTVFLLRPDR